MWLCLNSKCSRINFTWVTGFELQRFMRKLRLRMVRMRKPSQRMSHLWNSLSLPPLLKGSRRYVITDTCSYDSHMMEKYMWNSLKSNILLEIHVNITWNSHEHFHMNFTFTTHFTWKFTCEFHMLWIWLYRKTS